jgi:hypothetical protein
VNQLVARCPSSQSRVSRRCAQLPGFKHDTPSSTRVDCLAEERRVTTDNEDNMFIEANPTQNVGSRLSRSPPIATASVDVGQRLSKFRNNRGVSEIRYRGEGIRVHRHFASARPSTCLNQYGRGGHDPLSLLRDAVPLRSSIDRVRCQPAGQPLC